MPLLEIKPQSGPQTEFLASPADVVIFGGQAYGGKSYGLLLEPLRHCRVPGFGAVIFRRTTKQVRNKGGLWDTARAIYGQMPGVEMLDATLKIKLLKADITFGHLEYEKDIYNWDGAQIPLLGFDELQHFGRSQFLYLLSRNRSTCGVPAYCRCTCNPDPDSWILELIGWWIGEDGYPIEERSGKLRYFWTANDKFVTARTAAELRETYKLAADTPIKSVTFIPGAMKYNVIGMEADPSYRANLEMQSEAERARLLLGNWKVRPSGKMFKRAWFKEVDADKDRTYVRVVVGVDPSGGSGKGHDDQGIVAVAQGSDGKFYVLEDATCSLTPAGWGKMAVETYHAHKADLIVAEGNYGGDMVISTIQTVDTYANVQKVTASRGKAVRAQPVASLYEKGVIFHVGAKPELENELAGFDPDDTSAPSPNRMDALVWAMTELMGGSEGMLGYYRMLDEQDEAEAKAKEKKRG